MKDVWKYIAVTSLSLIMGWAASAYTKTTDSAAVHAVYESRFEILQKEIRGMSERLVRVETLLQEEMRAHHGE